ncbi:MAG: amidohydrolase [Clostridia bacterium]|nr:amidohydrolase [Clostridia bacterium]
MKDKKFYDNHFHAMNLSHPYLLAFVQRFNLQLLLAANAFLGGFASAFIGKKINKIKNLFSVMENDTKSFFILVEDYLKESELIKDGHLVIGENKYSKIVLTPLIIDFGFKGADNPDIFYNKASQKPVLDQILDVLNGIREYTKERPDGIFEIYPFLGINTKNYHLKDETSEKVIKVPNLERLNEGLKNKVKYKEKSKKLVFYGRMSINEYEELIKLFVDERDKNSIKRIYQYSQDVGQGGTLLDTLDKYFGEYIGTSDDLFSNMGGFEGDIDSVKSNYFAGIKLYPPLGFDPWPEDDEEELEKVKYLYEYCCRKRIPITTHCNNGGFSVLDKKEARRYTSPARWEKVLQKYPDLKINFAHFGGQSEIMGIIPVREWFNTVLTLITKYEYVYADFSYNGVNPKTYRDLRKAVHNLPDGAKEKVLNRILFGSDFCVNLIDIDSYNEYLDKFSKIDVFNDDEKDMFCRINSERFLFY